MMTQFQKYIEELGKSFSLCGFIQIQMSDILLRFLDEIINEIDR